VKAIISRTCNPNNVCPIDESASSNDDGTLLDLELYNDYIEKEEDEDQARRTTIKFMLQYTKYHIKGERGHRLFSSRNQILHCSNPGSSNRYSFSRNQE
jgi:hypothetical protein